MQHVNLQAQPATPQARSSLFEQSAGQCGLEHEAALQGPARANNTVQCEPALAAEVAIQSAWSSRPWCGGHAPATEWEKAPGAHLGEQLDGAAESRGARQKQDPLGGVPAEEGPEELRALGGGVLQRVGLVADDHAEVALVAAQLLREVVGGDHDVAAGRGLADIQLLAHVLHSSQTLSVTWPPKTPQAG